MKLTNIRIKSGFLGQKHRLALDHIIPYQWAALNDEIEDAEPSHAIENFKIAAGRACGEFHGMVFQDSDVAKWLEAAAYSLASREDDTLRKRVSETVDLVAEAQEEDGYLNTFFTVKDPDGKWKNLTECHELYCSGHMLEAAVALQEECNEPKLLAVMKKNIELIAGLLGTGESQIRGYPGHQEIELALVKLYRIGGEKKYLDLAKYFIDERGREPCFFDLELKSRKGKTFWGGKDYDNREYFQVHLPVREQTYGTGHAVRAVYMYSAMADIALETGDESLREACRNLWNNITGRQMFITGGIGSSAHLECFTSDYDLPNDTTYNETCASIGFAFWAFSMLKMEKDGRYGDILEKQIYNGIPSGLSADGTRFFYVNPLEIGSESARNRADHTHVKPERQQWFGCACCPPNIARFFASIGKYFYSVDEQSVSIHLYEASDLSFTIGGARVEMQVDTEYPRYGTVEIVIIPAEELTFSLNFRVPGWCRGWRCSVNGETVEPPVEKGYGAIHRKWKPGDTVVLEFVMAVQLVRANPLIHEDAGKLAVMKGPVVFCVEEADNGNNLAGVYISEDEFQEKGAFAVKTLSDTAGGCQVIEMNGKKLKPFGKDTLYSEHKPEFEDMRLLFVPYHFWGNRGSGEMRVWVNELF